MNHQINKQTKEPNHKKHQMKCIDEVFLVNNEHVFADVSFS